MKKSLLSLFLLITMVLSFTPGLMSQVPDPSCEFTMAQVACLEQHVTITYTGGTSPNATYLWNFDSAQIVSGSGQGPYIVRWLTTGMKTVTLHIQWEGQTCENVKQIHVVPLPQLFHMTGGGAIPAGGQGVHVGLSGSQNEVIYKLYRNGEYTNVYIVGNGQPIDFGIFTQPGTYTCKARWDGSECFREMEGTAVITNTQVPVPHICIVTFDTLSHHNKILWNNVEGGIPDHYNIYREIHINNEFEKIGEVPYGQPCIFIDTVANPLVKSDRYKISATDPGGFTSPLSPHHKTIHLNISPGVFGFNLIWNHYEGFEYKTYKIYRKNGTGPFVLIDSVASNVDSYTDFYFTSGVCYYYIEVIRLEPCNPSLKSGEFGSSVSNIALSAPLGIEESELAGVVIYPNPASDQLFIRFREISGNGIQATILTPDGRQVMRMELSDQQSSADISFLSPGLYLLRLTGSESSSVFKFLKK